MDVLCEERPHAIDRLTHRLNPRHLVDRHDDTETVLQLRHEFERLEGIETQVSGQRAVRRRFDRSSAYTAEDGQHVSPNSVSVRRCHRQIFAILTEQMTSLYRRTACSVG